MKNEEKLAEICKKEEKILLKQQWLVLLFFVAAAVVVGIICYVFVAIDYGDVAAIIILITLSVFASIVISGYFYDKSLSKKLDRLWEQKKLLS